MEVTISRDPSWAIKQQLRQEACLGCVDCGAPFLQYHHIIPWHEEHHNRPEDMVAVCPTCHTRFDIMNRDKQYRKKKNPYNATKSHIFSEMEFLIGLAHFMVGGNTFMNVPNLVCFNNSPVVGWSRKECGDLVINATLWDRDGSEILAIRENDVVSSSGFWDFEFKPNIITIRDKKRSILWQIDLRK